MTSLHHVVTPMSVDRPRRSNGTAGQMEGKTGWWTRSGASDSPNSKGQASGETNSQMNTFYINQMSTETLNDIVSKRIKIFGHVVRKEEMVNLVETGFVEGKRAQGRQRET